MSVEIIQGDCLEVLRGLPAESVNCCVTSPPYWGLRSYGTNPQVWGGDTACDHQWADYMAPGQTGGTASFQTANAGSFHSGGACGAWRGELGMEPTPELFVEHIVLVFREVRRVLRSDGLLWMNLGDTYAGGGRGGGAPGCKQRTNAGSLVEDTPCPPGFKRKDLVGVPWRAALALQRDGWYLRSDIIWHKPNPMPESVTDRCTKSHEYIFMLAKSEKYYFNQAAILEPVSASSIERLTQPSLSQQIGSDRVPGETNGRMKAVRRPSPSGVQHKQIAMGREQPGLGSNEPFAERNKRSVWTVTTKPFKGAHFATFPMDLITPCILAGCPEGGTVLDPFFGTYIPDSSGN